MKEEIKEILDYLKTMLRENEPDIELSREEVKLLLDYITNLQEQLHQASLDIQELTEKDIGCPSWCDKLTNLQEENKILKEKNYLLIDYQDMEIRYNEYKQRNEKAIEKLESIGVFGLRSGKTLFSTLINETIDILKGDKDE